MYLCVAGKKTGQPVKLRLDRDDDIILTVKGMNFYLNTKLDLMMKELLKD